MQSMRQKGQGMTEYIIIVALMIRNAPAYAGAGPLPLLYLIGTVILALAIAAETYFQNERWPVLAAGAVVGATVLSAVLMVTTTLPAPGYALDPVTGMPTGELFPGTIRLLTPFMNITGAFALVLGFLATLVAIAGPIATSTAH